MNYSSPSPTKKISVLSKQTQKVRVNRKGEILPQWRGTEFLSYKHKTMFYADTRTLVRVNRTVYNRPQWRGTEFLSYRNDEILPQCPFKALTILIEGRGRFAHFNRSDGR